ncbi:uncharacterized protein SAMN05192549_107226 [Duganella sacchari]|uniref:YecA family protein n=2 Tax=Duganella sacchari TaxID=551987 RepID=A0A1M7QL36_9BURK|nr:uncharacterized protein SAMN05192549_107226 [Duganella sacchari]
MSTCKNKNPGFNNKLPAKPERPQVKPVQWRLLASHIAMSTTPLNDDEYDQLDDLLAAIGPQSMDVARLEGFLTALVIGPAELAQDTWLPHVWGDAEGNSQAAALVLRHHAYMREWMQKDPASFEPIYECGGSWNADAWSAGFLAGVQLATDAWAPLRAQQPALLLPFQPPVNATKVTPSVIQINAFFHAPQPKAAKAGRNDPCPCGSGQKYKKCCGA